MNRNFMQLLRNRWAQGFFVCVGLDPDIFKIPKHLIHPRLLKLMDQIQNIGFAEFVKRANLLGPYLGDAILRFNQEIIKGTGELLNASKPNWAFYSRYGKEGLRALIETIRFIEIHFPDVAAVLDAKVGDIGKTNDAYVQFLFEAVAQADATTLHPYLGMEAMLPFLSQSDKGCVILCRTSNKGAGEFQDRRVEILGDELEELTGLDRHQLTALAFKLGWNPVANNQLIPFYQLVAMRVARHWNQNGNCALVVGATYPEELSRVRQLVGNLPLLIPGIGAQGGDVEKTVKAGMDSLGQGMIVNSSSGIIYASGGEDFVEAARRETLELHKAINLHRQ